MSKQKSVFGLWSEIRAADLNRLLKPYGVRLVVKSSRNWGDQVHVTAQPIGPAQDTFPSGMPR